jgi:CMP-N-acetylneuraminic acid synthetase
MYREGKDGLLIKLLPSTERRRQDIPVTYLLNGAIFCAFTNELLAVDGEFRRLSLKPFIMDKIDSLDIDDFSDFETAELVALNRRNGAE